MSINNGLVIPNNFFKLSSSVIMNMYSFLTEQEIAVIANCDKIFSILQKRHLNILNENRSLVLKNLIVSKERIFACSLLRGSIKIRKDYLSFTDKNAFERVFFDLKNFKTHPDSIINQWNIPFKDGPFDEKVSVLKITDKDSEETNFLIIDNVKRSVMDRISFIHKNYEYFISIFGREKEPGNSLEFATSEGNIYLYNPDSSALRESDNKESAAKYKIFSLNPVILKQKSKKDLKIEAYLKKAFKVKKSYYFQWEPKSTLNRKLVTFIKDIFPLNHETLLLHSEECCSDDHFFYTTLGQEIFIFKDGLIWKKISLGPETFDVKLYPSDYGLVIIYNQRKKYNDESADSKHLTIWNHKKNESNNTLKPFFSQEITKSSNFHYSTQFVCKNVLFYNNGSRWSMYHIPTKKELGTMIIRDQIESVYVSDEYLPKYFVFVIEKIDCSKEYEIHFFTTECTEDIEKE